MENTVRGQRPARRRLAPARRRWARRAAHPRGQAGNLPRELTTFIGRQHQVEQVSLALGTAGLVTLVGPGGVGKTRLALRIAAALKANYAHGAWLAELAPVTDAHGVVAAVADALAVRERPGQDLLTSLRMALQPRQMLLVLDNCEHVLQSCAELVTALLRTCDSLSILATSRRPLGVSGEVVSPVGPLPIASTHEPIDTMIECDAVQLLAAGIEAAQPGFALDPSSAVLAGEICHLVDGLPLGIELAASRARTMTLTEIAAGLSDPLRLLTLGPSTAPTRQQTLRAAIDWSYALLGEREASVLRRLAMFSGGCTLAGLEAVCDGRGTQAGDLVDALDHLVAHSLVIADTRGAHTRFSMLETVRRYCLERLDEAGETREVLERHRDWCLQVADGPPPEAFDTTQVERLAPDLDNLRAALRWTLETRQLAAAAQLALGLTIVWHLRGSFSEGRAALTAVLDLAPDDCALAEVAHAGSWASVMATTQGDYLAAEQLLPRAVKIARASGDAYVLLFAENQLGWVAYTRGDIGTARDLYERTHRIVSATGGPFHPVSQYQLALCCIEQGDCVRAQELVDTFPEVPTASGRAFHTGRLLYVRALLAEQAGDYVGADALFERAILAQQALDDQPGLLRSLTLRGAVMAAQGDRQIAAAALAEAFEASELHASKLTVAHLLEAVANLVLDTDVVACVRLAAAAGHLRTVVGAAPLPTEQHRLGRYLDIARQRIGEPAYAGAWLAAEAESLDDSLVLAGQLLSSVGNAPVRSATNRQGDALSERERQVALLVTRGYNNREIAEELVISLKTAEAHIHHILNKLGLSNRVQIATWGLRHGIASSEVGKALQPDRAWATLS